MPNQMTTERYNEIKKMRAKIKLWHQQGMDDDFIGSQMAGAGWTSPDAWKRDVAESERQRAIREERPLTRVKPPLTREKVKAGEIPWIIPGTLPTGVPVPTVGAPVAGQKPLGKKKVEILETPKMLKPKVVSQKPTIQKVVKKPREEYRKLGFPEADIDKILGTKEVRPKPKPTLFQKLLGPSLIKKPEVAPAVQIKRLTKQIVTPVYRAVKKKAEEWMPTELPTWEVGKGVKKIAEGVKQLAPKRAIPKIKREVREIVKPAPVIPLEMRASKWGWPAEKQKEAEELFKTTRWPIKEQVKTWQAERRKWAGKPGGIQAVKAGVGAIFKGATFEIVEPPILKSDPEWEEIYPEKSRNLKVAGDLIGMALPIGITLKGANWTLKLAKASKFTLEFGKLEPFARGYLTGAYYEMLNNPKEWRNIKEKALKVPIMGLTFATADQLLSRFGESAMKMQDTGTLKEGKEIFGPFRERYTGKGAERVGAETAITQIKVEKIRVATEMKRAERLAIEEAERVKRLKVRGVLTPEEEIKRVEKIKAVMKKGLTPEEKLRIKIERGTEVEVREKERLLREKQFKALVRIKKRGKIGRILTPEEEKIGLGYAKVEPFKKAEPLKLGLPKVEKVISDTKTREISPAKIVEKAKEIKGSNIVENYPVKDIYLDPKRLQYKIFEKPLKGPYKRKYEGLPLVWRDPEDGLCKAVNCHRRVALARKEGIETMTVKFINDEAKTVEDAKFLGAMTNIVDDKGTAFDAANWIRSQKLAKEDLTEMGIYLSEKVAGDGFALANLHKGLFNMALRGELPYERAVIIGSKVFNPDAQLKLMKFIGNKKITNEVVSELADVINKTPGKVAEQVDMFGKRITTEPYFMERVNLSAYIRGQLKVDKKLFGTVTKYAGRLADEDIVVDIRRTENISRGAAQLLGLFDKEKNLTGEISNILNKGAEEIGKGGKVDEIYPGIYQQTRETISRIIRGEKEEAIKGTEGLFATGAKETIGGVERAKPAVEKPTVGVKPVKEVGKIETKKIIESAIPKEFEILNMRGQRTWGRTFVSREEAIAFLKKKVTSPMAQTQFMVNEIKPEVPMPDIEEVISALKEKGKEPTRQEVIKYLNSEEGRIRFRYKGRRIIGEKKWQERLLPEGIPPELKGKEPFFGKEQKGLRIGKREEFIPPPSKKESWTAWPFRSVYARLEKMSPKLVKKIQRMETTASIGAGQDKHILDLIEKKNLTQEELNNVREALRGRAEPINDRVRAVFNGFDRIRRRQAQAFKEAKGQVKTALKRKKAWVPFREIKDYFPYCYDQAQFQKSSTYNEILDFLVRSPQFPSIKNPAQANQFLQYRAGGRLARHLEYPRLWEPEDVPSLAWEKDPIKAFRQIIEPNWRRIAEIQEFGPRGEIAKELMGKAMKEGWDYKGIERLYKIAMGQREYEVPKTTAELFSELRGLQAFKLTFAALPNWTQRYVNNLLEYGLRRTAGTQVKKWLSPGDFERLAAESGADLDIWTRQFIQQATGGTGKIARAGAWWVRKVRFTLTEIANKKFSANVGASIVRDSYTSLLKNPNNKGAQKILESLGLNYKEMLNRGLVKEDLARGGNAVWRRTQFAYSPGEFPEWANHPLGKLIWQFKGYSYNQSKLLYRNLISSEKPLATRAKNWVYFLTISPAFGEVIGTIRDKISGRPRENIIDFIMRQIEDPNGKEIIEREINSITWVGAMGIISDWLQSLKYGEKGMWGATMGPTAGTTVQGATAIWKGFPSRERFLLRQIPGVGQRIQRELLPTKFQEQQMLEYIYQLMAKGEWEEVRKLEKKWGVRPTKQGRLTYEKRTRKTLTETLKEKAVKWIKGAPERKKKARKFSE